jgi:hypothetical protein
MSTQIELRAKIKKYIRLRLGDNIVDVELDPEHLDMSIDQAFLRYRQRSQNSLEESYAFLDLQEETQTYTLPNEIMNVRQIFRRGIGSSTGSTTSQFEPFAAGYMNTYMLMSGRVGGMLSYELYAGRQELAMRMFGGFMNFTFNPGSKKLTIVRKMPVGSETETVLLWADNYKPEVDLLTNHMTYPWLQDYSYAVAKYTLGEAREKFATIAGPQGGTTLNGSALKAEAKAAMDELELELKTYVDGSQPLSFVIG